MFFCVELFGWLVLVIGVNEAVVVEDEICHQMHCCSFILASSSWILYF